ncbi:MAG: hypothetical protein H6747_10710 [Deltaproteobacteria bacterium]|nr:hypothetical protein [Deltaproteobacteria bacterium]
MSQADQRAAALLSEQGIEAARVKDYAVAARLYHRAFALDPSQSGYLYSAAVAEMKAGDHAAARRDFERVVAAFPADDRFVGRARERLAQLDAAARPPQPSITAPPTTTPPITAPPATAPPATAPPTEPKPAAPAPALKATPDTGWTARGVAGWSLIGAATVGVGIGAALGWRALGDRQTLKDTYFDSKTERYVGITVDALNSRESAINNQITQAWVVGGIGVGAAAIGALLLIGRGEGGRATVLLLPNRSGAELSATLRF